MGSLISEGLEAKIHVVCVPYPAQGHTTPMLDLAKLLHSKGFHITYVNTEYNHRRWLRARGPNSMDGLKRFRFEAFPDGLPPSDANVTQDIPALNHAIMNYMLEPFKECLVRIKEHSSGSPSVSFILSDSLMPFTLDAAKEMGVSLVWLWTASVCGYLGHCQYREFLNRGIVPFKDSSFLRDGTLDTVADFVSPSLKGIQYKHIPSFIRTTDKDEPTLHFLKYSVETTAQSSAPVIFNTFDAFEHETLVDTSKIITGPIYTIGPLREVVKKLPKDDDVNSLASNLWKEDLECLEWLDLKNEKSVLYVSFGSITTMSSENLIEFAWGLANSGHPFLWILRPDLVNGATSIITPEFLSETKDRGLITSWCNQEKVLNHPSVGAFLTHCGWNSTLETIHAGVPVLCWTYFGDQPINCWFSIAKWKIGMEIDNDVKRNEVEKQVREIIEGEKGKEMRRHAMEYKILAAEATASPTGSSFINFDKLINEVLINQNENPRNV